MPGQSFWGNHLVDFLLSQGLHKCEENAVETILCFDCDDLLGKCAKIQQTKDKLPPAVAEFYLTEVLGIDVDLFWKYIQGK